MKSFFKTRWFNFEPTPLGVLLSELLCWSHCSNFVLVINYEVSVVTGDVRAAGTNAKVFMQIYGETGKTELIILENRSNNFERGATDIFKVWWRHLLPLLWGEVKDQPKLRHQESSWPSQTKQLALYQNCQVFCYLMSSIYIIERRMCFFQDILCFFVEVLWFMKWFSSPEEIRSLITAFIYLYLLRC